MGPKPEALGEALDPRPETLLVGEAQHLRPENLEI